MSGPSILFVLPVRGASGGANSVVQEALGLGRLGCRMGIAVSTRHAVEFGANYPELSGSPVSVHLYGDTADLAGALGRYEIAVATVNNSVFEIQSAADGGLYLG